MADGDGQAQFICEGLQFTLPQPHACAVTATAVSGDQQIAGIGVTRAAHGLPPAPDGLNGEAGGIVIDADAYPASVAGNVEDPIRHGAAEFGDPEIVRAHLLRLSLGAKFTATVLESLPSGLTRGSPTSSFFLVSTEIAG